MPGTAPLTHDADARGFSEKDFYLNEFRGRAVGIALAESCGESSVASLVRVLDELAANDTATVLLAAHPGHVESLTDCKVVRTTEPSWEAILWRGLRAGKRIALVPRGDVAFPAACREVVSRLRLAKFVWTDSGGALERSEGGRRSVLDLADLDELLESDDVLTRLGARVALLREIQAMIDGGLPTANLCRLDQLADELFTYAGAGTFFTPLSFVEVRTLSLDEFDAAHDLVRRGVSEGYLVRRDEGELDRVLSSAFGVFVEGRYLAGIGSLLIYPEAHMCEIVSVYTLTRFLREGVGGHLVRFARARAEEVGLQSLFACTTSEKVEGFFIRHGFRRAKREELPDRKWDSYSGERQAGLRCLILELSP